MPITTQLNEKANVKQSTGADTLIAGRKIVSLQEIQTSTLNQTAIIIGTFAVDVANSKNLIVVVNGAVLTEGASNDYELTSVSANNTSNTITLSQSLPAGLNIKLLYLGVVVTESTSLDTLTPAMSDWIPFTMQVDATVTNPTKGTTVRDTAYWRRVGDSMEFRWDYEQSATGSNGSGIYLFKIPGGYQIDPNKTPIIGNTGLGDGIVGIGAWNNSTTAAFLTRMFAYDNTHLAAHFQNAAGTYVVISDSAGFGAAWVMTFTARVPIAGWSSNVIAENSKVFKASAYATNGTNVTTTPDELGEYRTYIKDAGALTATDNAPNGAYAPSNANGFRIDGSANFASAGTSGQPNRIEIFIGRDKHPEIEAYFGAGRSGAVNLAVKPNTATLFYGVSFEYDPTSGLMIVDAIEQLAGTTSRFAARSMPASGTASSDLGNIYFEVNVSDNVLPVQYSDPSKVARNVVWQYVANGYGSVALTTRRWTNTHESTGTAISYNDSVANGGSWTINEAGMYTIDYSDQFNATDPTGTSGISLNATTAEQATAIDSITPTKILGIAQRSSSDDHSRPLASHATLWLDIGDVIRAQTRGQASGVNPMFEFFRITKHANG